MTARSDASLVPHLIAASPVHAPILAELQAACFETPWGTEAFTRLLALPGHAAWLLMRGEQPLGYALFQLIADEGELLSIAVVPEQQGLGLGAWLLEKTLKNCENRNIKRIILDVRADNVPAQALYKKQNFNQVGIRKGYYNTSGGTKVDALVLAREETTQN